MPPRYAYWTILVDEQPTAFRAAAQEDLQPTFKRLKEKHASARMVWFQNGKIWNSRLDAQEAMRARGEKGRSRDFRQREALSQRKPARRADFRESKGEERDASGKLEWKPKGEGAPRAALVPRDHLVRRSVRDAKPAWKPKADRADWKPKGDRPQWKPQGDRPQWKPKANRQEWSPKGDRAQSRFKSDRPQWKPKTDGRAQREKLEWRPKGQAPGPRPQAPGPGRDKNWRPGGEHRDPRQKYKDAKKAKWTRFKQTIRKRWESKQEGVPKKKKRRDEE